MRRIQRLLQRLALRARLVERALCRRAVRVRQLLRAAKGIRVQFRTPRRERGDLLRTVLHVRLLLPEGRLLRRQAGLQRLQRRERLLLRRVLRFERFSVARGRRAQGGEGICQRVRVERRRQCPARLRERFAHGPQLPAQPGCLRAAVRGRFLRPVAVR